MKEVFEEQLKEVIAIAETCPELYKVECFKILLKYQLSGNKPGIMSPNAVNSAAISNISFSTYSHLVMETSFIVVASNSPSVYLKI